MSGLGEGVLSATVAPADDQDDSEVVDLRTRTCGAVHTDGATCTLNVLWEPGCCTDIVYDHDGPHEHHLMLDGKDVVAYRWFEVLVIKDCPFNAYGPWTVEGDDDGS